MLIIVKKIQKFIEDHVFRKDGERFIMLLTTLVSTFFNYCIIIFTIFETKADGQITTRKDYLIFVLFLLIVDLFYVLLMRKMIVQYIRKHQVFDSKHWNNGIKGKLRVLAKWFDRGE